MLDWRLVDHLLQRRGEVFENDDGFRAGVLELVLELAWRVERVHVHGNEAGTQYRRNRNRILQHVGHHAGHAVALLQTEAL